MTGLEALGTIKRFMTIRYNEKVREALGIIEVELEKQIPKKIIKKHSHDDFYKFYCPNCNEENMNPNAHYKHCPNCGQKLDWKE